MIGVIADPSEEEVVREFFELFKTPWEFYRADRSYAVLLAAGDAEFNLSAKLAVVYGGRQTKFDEKRAVAIRQQSDEPSVRSFDRRPLPLYGESVTFDERGLSLVQDPVSGECVAFLELAEGRAVARVGYDLFQEVRALLTTGQPIVNAAEPALELHIALLRDVITRAGVPLVEIPAVPDGFQFIACLTHDVDHPTVRAHKWDHTVWGFIYRATFGSLQRLVRGEIPFSSLLASWLAVAKLPFVYMGLASDFWGQFGDCYLNAEGDLPSTFFVIPRKNDPGKVAGGLAPAFRASKYAARDIAGTLQKLIRHGREVGLHGIDAWLDSAVGATELAEVAGLTGTR